MALGERTFFGVATSLVAVLLTFGLSLESLARQQVVYEIGGEQQDDRLGDSVSGAGDVNADGFDDFIAGAPNSDRNGQNSGFVRIHSGIDASVLYYYEGNSGDKLGESSAGIGDIDGDGYGDFIIGSPSRDHGAKNNVGRAYVRSGLDGSIIFLYQGVNEGAEIGRSVSGGGDANNDGHCDFIVGSTEGAAWIRSGLDGGLLHALVGHTEGVRPGWAVSGAGDVNGDGHDDAVCGFYLWQSDSGILEVYSGLDGSVLFFDTGAAAGHNLGFSVSGAGDVNRDGYDDVIGGAPAYGFGYGTARVYRGNTWVLQHEFDEQWSSFGRSVSGAGDINNDGHSDVVVGAPNAHVGGGVWAYSGQNGASIFAIEALISNDALGRSVSGAGDVDDDGFSDIIAGAPVTRFNGNDQSGAVLVVSGDECGTIRELSGGCVGSGGFTPDLSLEGCMVVGGQATIRLENGPGGAPAALLMSINPGFTQFPNGCGLALALPATLFVVGPLSGSGPGDGSWFTATSVPNLPGFRFFVGAVIKDGGNTLTSNALDVEIAL